jgi:hypothetical protein
MGAVFAALVATRVAAEGRADPRVDYMIQCQGCHLADGSGLPGAVPPLQGRLGRFLEVPGGRAFLVKVPGSAQSALDDARLASVLNWMIRRFGPKTVAARFRPYDAAEVARWRREPLVDVAAERARIVSRIDAADRASR